MLAVSTSHSINTTSHKQLQPFLNRLDSQESFASKQVISKRINAPRYSLQTKPITHTKAVLISPQSGEMKTDMIGKDSPGVGVYNTHNYRSI